MKIKISINKGLKGPPAYFGPQKDNSPYFPVRFPVDEQNIGYLDWSLIMYFIGSVNMRSTPDDGGHTRERKSRLHSSHSKR